jgi:hypothetical protein
LYLNGQFDGATVDPYPNQVNMYLTLGIVNNRGICRRRGRKPLCARDLDGRPEAP